MSFNFELILFYATVITGVIALLDIFFFAPKRSKNAKMPLIFDYSRSFFPVLLIVFVLRSFVFEPFRIPSGSLEPTLLTGDFILVNKFDYGVRLPVIHKKLIDVGEPKRGDIVVFRWPADPSFDFIKRVVGVPGDHISYVNKELYINGQKINQATLSKDTAYDELGREWQPEVRQEDLLGVKHDIYVDPDKSGGDTRDITVPEGMYFMMGDNRDNSNDSRYWGFVPEKNIVGKAVMIWMSWDKYTSSLSAKLRLGRIGKMIT